jgi:hypothetical protein
MDFGGDYSNIFETIFLKNFLIPPLIRIKSLSLSSIEQNGADKIAFQMILDTKSITFKNAFPQKWQTT